MQKSGSWVKTRPTNLFRHVRYIDKQSIVPDYDLALRDQRMLNNLGKISRRTRMTLRNNLTRRFPAVPLPRQQSMEGREEGGDDGEKKLLDLGEDVEFLGVRPDPKLSKQMQQWKDGLEDRLKGKEKPPQYWEFPELEKGNVHKHCSKCMLIDCGKDFDWANPGKPEDKACPVVKCKWQCGVVFHSCKLFEHQMICPK